jgi:CRP-like cAMP-binding protein
MSTVATVTGSLQEQARTGAKAVRVLDADPDLGAGIEESQFQLAAGFAVARAFELDRGPWRFSPPPDPGGFGALVLDGLIVIRVGAGTRSHVELLGEGDLISPWVRTCPSLTAPSLVTASVVSRARIALLDRHFAVRTARWPELHAALMHRLIMRSRRLSLQSAINALPRIEERLDVTLWELGYRFGRVTPDGVALELPITHAQLADMVAARRPSVTLAAARLREHGRLVRRGRHRWLLLGEPPSALSQLTRKNGRQA